MKKIAPCILIALVVIYFLASWLVPPIFDKKLNKVFIEAPYDVSPEAQTLYNSLNFIADLHCDALLWKRDLLVKNDFGAVDIPRMLEANEALQAFTIVTKAPKKMNFENNTGETDQITLLNAVQGRPLKSWFNLTQRAIAQCNALFRFQDKSKGEFRVILAKGGLQEYIQDRISNPNITAGYLGIEGMHCLEGDIKNVDKLYDAGVRMMAPVHFFDNKLGGSAHGVEKGGLTEFGKAVLKKMEEKKMIVDVAHSSEALLDDILQFSTRPLLSSHTGLQAVCPTIRNISDKHLRQIAATGGLIGIAMFEHSTCGTTPASSAKAIKHCINVVGADYVALGSDFDGAITTHTDVTGLPLYVEEMMKLGISDVDIKKVMGDNVKRFLLNNLPD